MKKETDTLVVVKKEVDEDRILLYGTDPGYHIIADMNVKVKVGDTIEYEPCGYNFGWFVKVVSPAKSKKSKK